MPNGLCKSLQVMWSLPVECDSVTLVSGVCPRLHCSVSLVWFYFFMYLNFFFQSCRVKFFTLNLYKGFMTSVVSTQNTQYKKFHF